MRMGARRERGQVLPLVAVVMVVAGGLCLVVGRIGGRAVGEAQAATAADAAALAGAGAGPKAASRSAAANGATIVHYEADGADTRVRVALDGGAKASARARRRGGQIDGPAPALRAALARAAQLLGAPVPMVPAAPNEVLAGDAAARHARGLAVDVAPSTVAALAPVAAAAGLCRPYPEEHPVHFELCPYRLR